MTAVERVAAWVDGQGKTLLLNDDGRLLERETPRSSYRQVQYPTSGTQALLYAASKGYELVGEIPPTDFQPPVKETIVATANKTRDKSKAQQYYDHAQGIIEEEGLSNQAAFKVTAEHFGTSPANISTAFYRIKRQVNGDVPRADHAAARRTVGARQVVPVPEDLQNITPMIKAGMAAFDQMIEWVRLKEEELNERERTIEAREQEVKARLQKQLDQIFG